MKVSSLVLPILAVSACVCAVILTATNLLTEIRRREAPPSQPFDMVADVRPFSELATPIDTRGGLPRMIVFSDYECGACRLLEKRLSRYESKLSEIGLAYVQFPLEGHAAAPAAARAALCASNFGRFAAYHKALFSRASVRGAPWIEVAMAVGISDTTAFADCLTSVQTTARLANHLAAGRKLGIVATPTLVIGNAVYVGTPAGIEQLLDAQLELTRSDPTIKRVGLRQ